MTDALFERLDDHTLEPTPFSLGPWSPHALHGGPPAALLAREVERFEAAGNPFVARLTVELLRPVPLAPLTVSARWVRQGRKVQLVEATLDTESNTVARVTALRIRQAEVPLPPLPPEDAPSFPRPEEGTPLEPSPHFHDGFHNKGVEHRFVRGAMDRAGPATDWIRLLVPVVGGEEPTSLCRTIAVADFGNGLSGVLPGTHTYINPDLTVYLHRAQRGEWTCLDARTRVSPNGVGVAESQLFDVDGPIGRATQSLIIEAL